MIVGSNTQLIKDTFEDLKPHFSSIACINEEVTDSEVLLNLEQAKIIVLNDKFLSKFKLNFYTHGTPSLLINLDLPDKYCSLLKRIRFVVVNS